MATQAAKNLKKIFSKTPEEEFEPLTFEELKIEENFISFPLPGDNSGHGGFRETSWIFIKTKENKAKNKKHGTESDFSHSMLVIRIA